MSKNLLPALIEAALSLGEDSTPEQRVAAVRAVLDENPGVDLAGLEESVLKAFGDSSSADGEAPTDDQLMELERLADVADAVRSRRAELTAAADARAARAREIADRVARVNAERDAEAGTTEETAPEGGDGGTETQAGGEPGGSAPLIPVAEPAAQPVPEPVAASVARELATRAPVRVPLNQDPKHLPPGRQASFQILAASDVPGHSAGTELTDITAVTSAVMAKMRTLGQGGQGYSRQGIIQIRRNTSPEFTADGSNSDWSKIEAAANPSRLGNALTAATGGGGWCAPSEVLYDLCPGASTDGLVDVPSVTITRGGIRWPNTPDFGSIYTGSGLVPPSATGSNGFIMDETTVKGLNYPDTVKPCYEVPCPDFSECRMDIVGLCLKAGILTQHAYPELVQWFVEQSMIAHVHRLNAEILNRMSKMACPVDFPGWAAVAGPPAVPAIQAGLNATSTLLDAIELQAYDLRYKYRWSENEVLEVVLPLWAKGIIRSDIGKRNAWAGDNYNVSDAQVAQWFAVRNLRVQWVVDWQDALNNQIPATTNPDTTNCPALTSPPTYTFGGVKPATAWPTQVHALVYKAGTFVRGSADVITIDGLYDSVTLATNRYTALFMEEGLCLIKRCFDARLIRMTVCPNGASGPQIWPADCSKAV